MTDRRRLAIAAVAVALGFAAVQHPSANLRIITHDISDAAPRRLQIGADLGIVAVSFLYTWTANRITR